MCSAKEIKSRDLKEQTGATWRQDAQSRACDYRREPAFQFLPHRFKGRLGPGNPREPKQGLDKQLQGSAWAVVKGMASHC